MKKRILFITTQFPYPPHGGGKLVTLQHVSLLLKEHTLDFVCKAEIMPDGNVIDQFKKCYPVDQLIIIPHWIRTRQNAWKAIKTLAKATFKKLPFKIIKYYNPEVERKIDHLLQECSYDFVVYDQLPSFQVSAFYRTHPKQILFAHNAEYETVSTYRSTQTNLLKRWLLKTEAKRLEIFERKTYHFVKNVVFLSNSDAAKFNEIKNSITLPTYIHIFPPVEDVNTTKKVHEPAKLLLVASWSWALNRDGLLWFNKNVLPLLNKAVEITIVGDGIETNLKHQLETKEFIRVIGKVSEVSSWYKSNDMVIIPLFGGSGIKIKLLDAMANGLPVVTTSFGIQGITDYSHGICVADNALDFARYIDTLSDHSTYYLEKKASIQQDYLKLQDQSLDVTLKKYLNSIAPKEVL